MKKIILLSILCSCSFFGCSLLGISTLENPDYEVLLTEDNNKRIELRNYSATKLVSTSAKGEFEESSNNNFRKLFKYISGENEKEKKISMTTPVFMSLDDSNKRQMSFVVPSENLEDTPSPSSSEVEISAFPERMVAVISFSGRWKEQSFKENEIILRNWILEKGFIVKSAAYAAAYDPPWAVPFLRTNEVHIAVDYQ